MTLPPNEAPTVPEVVVCHRYRDRRPPISEWMPVLTPGDLEYLLGRPAVYEVEPLVPASLLTTLQAERDAALRLVKMSVKAQAVEREHVARIAAEAERDALRTRVERLTGALDKEQGNGP